jgi:hypothetical protein
MTGEEFDGNIRIAGGGHRILVGGSPNHLNLDVVGTHTIVQILNSSDRSLSGSNFVSRQRAQPLQPIKREEGNKRIKEGVEKGGKEYHRKEGPAF